MPAPIKQKPSSTEPKRRSRNKKARKADRNWIFYAAMGGGVAALLLLGLLLGPTIFRIETEEGTVVVKSFDPNMVVTIKRNGDKVKDYTLTKDPLSTKLKTGYIEVTLKGKHDGVTINNGVFTLKNGETVVVTIEQQVAAAPTGKRTDEAKEVARKAVILQPTGKAPEVQLISAVAKPRKGGTMCVFSTDSSQLLIVRDRWVTRVEVNPLRSRFGVGQRGKICATNRDAHVIYQPENGPVFLRGPLKEAAGGIVVCADINADDRAVTAVNKDGTYLVQIWQRTRSNTRYNGTLLRHKPKVECAAISPSGNKVLAGAEDGLYVWDASGLRLGHFHKGSRVIGGAFSPSDKYAVFIDGTTKARKIEIPSGKILREYEHDNLLTALTISDDGRWLALGEAAGMQDSPGKIVVYDLETRHKRFELSTGNKTVTYIDISPDSRWLAACHGNLMETQIWRLPN